MSKLCDLSDWQNPAFLARAADIMALSPSPEHAIQHRKLWEFVKTLEALEQHQLLTPNSMGLSVAAGTERVLYYLARHVGKIVGTDIYGDGSFAYREAASSAVKNPAAFAPYDYPHDRLKLLYMNALNLSFSDNLFDFAFCLSSIEHFGGMKAAKIAVQEMARVVKPGGLVIVVTDCSLNGLQTDEVFLPREIEALAECSDAKLTAPIDWSLSEESLRHLVDMRKGDLNLLPHINLKLLGSVFTSVALVLQKPIAKSPDLLTSRMTRLDEEIKRAEGIKPVMTTQPALERLLLMAKKKLGNLRYRAEELLFYHD